MCAATRARLLVHHADRRKDRQAQTCMALANRSTRGNAQEKEETRCVRASQAPASLLLTTPGVGVASKARISISAAAMYATIFATSCFCLCHSYVDKRR